MRLKYKNKRLIRDFAVCNRKADLNIDVGSHNIHTENNVAYERVKPRSGT